VKKIRNQTITKKDNFNSIKDNKAKIMVPLLFLTMVLVLSFTVNDVSATNATSNNVLVSSSHNIAVTNTGQAVDSQTNVQAKSKTNTSKTNKASNSLSTKKNNKIPDPQIYRNGAPVARGGNPVGFVYPSIASAITVANAGDTIMLENGATFQEHGLVINKDLNFNVFSNGHATIDGQNIGQIFLISNGATVIIQNLILENGLGTFGGAIYNNGTLTVRNTVFQNNRATQNGGAIYNDGRLIYDAVTHTSETVTKNGGTLTVNNCTFTNNRALNGGAIYNAGTLSMSTSTTLTDFTITQNGGTLNVVNSVFTNNRATQNGGAIANDATFNVVGFSTLTRTVVTKNGGTATISGSTFIGNTANNGGAISNLAVLNTAQSTLTGTATTGTTALNSGTVTVTDSAIIGNTANNNGGAIYNGARTSVTATTMTDYTIDNDATITARFNTMAGNSALRGGAVYNDATSSVTSNTLTRTTLNNVATATTTDNALVDNHATTGRDIVNNVILTQNGNTPPNPIVSSTGTVDAMRNWWGSVAGPLSGDVVGTVDTSNFLIYAMNIVNTASNTHPNVGQQFHYTIIVTNNGPDTATDVQMTDGIPDGLTFNSFTASQGTYNHATEIWNIGTLASGASAVLQLFVTPTSTLAGTLVTKNATLINTNDTSSATVTVPGTPVSVILTKTASNLAPNVGQQFNYILTVINHGPNTATGVQVTDILPAGLTFNGFTASQGTYNSGTGLWNVGTLVNGAGAILHLFVTPTVSTAGTTVTNTATTTGQTASATVVVPTTTVPVVLSKTASNLAPNVGQQFNYIITATNNGPGTATGVVVTDKLPAGLTFNGFTASQGTYNSATGIWNVGTLVEGASAILHLFVTPAVSAAGTTVTNTATTTGQTLNAVVIVPATTIVNVVLTKTASTTTPRVGHQFHYTITATNNGPGTATGIQVTDKLPAGLTFNGFTASQGTYNSVTGIWNIGTILNGASATLRLFVTPTTAVVGQTLTNVARKLL
jgi:trimeric autotransporter adhesin